MKYKMKKIITLLLISSLTIISYSQQPNNLTTTNINTTSSTLNWENGGCTDSSYSLQYKESSSASWLTAITVVDTNGTATYTLINLWDFTTYNWRVKCSLGVQWSNGPDFTTTCNKNLDQHINGFNPDPLYSFWEWAYDTISLTNTSNCDIRVRPEFDISHDSLTIGTADFDLKWYNPYIGNWPDIPYYIDADGHAVGFWGVGGDSTGNQIAQGSTQQIIIRIKFRPNANYGKYSANWITQEVDSSGNFLQTLGTGDSTSISLVDCSIFNVDSS